MSLQQTLLVSVVLGLGACISTPTSSHVLKVKAEGLPLVLKIANLELYCGGQPQGELGFSSLAELGVRTVVNVGGASPDLKTAAKFGIEYVHIPIGYDGIDEISAAALQRVARDCEFPVYVHCYHGQHRGPAAAALIARAAGGIGPADAVKIMEAAETNPGYSGLWRDVREWVPLDAEDWFPELESVAVIDDFTAGMAAVDRVWDRMKLIRSAQWGTPPSHPDLVASLEADYLADLLFNTIHSASTGNNSVSRFNKLALESIEASRELVAGIKAGSNDAAEASFSRLGNACTQCHRSFRN
jgi:protein tyrosine phosphatase (PTP) superfamily phosphohydrolase (DUF442 family)